MLGYMTEGDVMFDLLTLLLVSGVSTLTSVTWSEMMGPRVSVFEATFIY